MQYIISAVLGAAIAYSIAGRQYAWAFIWGLALAINILAVRTY